MVPVAGALIGAGIGALAKAADGTGITKDDLERIRTEVVPGTSALHHQAALAILTVIPPRSERTRPIDVAS